MEQNIEKLLILLSDTEKIENSDELSKLIDSELNSELSVDELELVSAAAKTDYEKFEKLLEQKKLK